MTGHFYKNLNLHQLILDKRPGVILEVGSHKGDCTRLLASMIPVVPCRVVAISDRCIDIPGVEFITGISYREIPKLGDRSIGMAIVDTDHNYWTLARELEALLPKMEEGGLVVMHDVDEFYYNTGMAMSYWDGSSYPTDEINGAHVWGGLGTCVIDFLHTYRGYFKLVRWIPEHFGCAVIERLTTTGTTLITPGPGSELAPPRHGS